MRIEFRGLCLPRCKLNGQGKIVVVTPSSVSLRRILQAQMMAREVVEVVEGVLRLAHQVFGFGVLQVVGLNGDLEREDWAAGLQLLAAIAGS